MNFNILLLITRELGENAIPSKNGHFTNRFSITLNKIKYNKIKLNFMTLN